MQNNNTQISAYAKKTINAEGRGVAIKKKNKILKSRSGAGRFVCVSIALCF